MRITELRAENVKRIQAVEITPDGAAVVIGGRNGQGKSSVLDSIFWALGGSSAITSKPVRDGAEEATITVRLDAQPNLIVTRKIKADGKTTLDIRQVDENGVTMKVSSPQKMLDSLCSAVAFDPLAFTRLKPQQQAETLRNVLGIDFADIDAKEKDAFERRTLETRDHRSLQARYEAMPFHNDAPAAEVSVNDLVEELNQAQATNEKRQQKFRYIDQLKETIARQGSESVKIAEQISHLQKELDELSEARRLNKEQQSRAEREVEQMPLVAIEPIQERISNAERLNNEVRANAHRADVAAELKAKAKAVDDLTGTIERCREDRVARLTAADWPVDGLGFSADGVIYNNLPFEQCSSAEKLRISTAIGFAQNPTLKVLLIHDGSLLDDESLAEVTRLAEAHDGQVWVERVGDGAECSVVIEDGSVREVRQTERELVEA